METGTKRSPWDIILYLFPLLMSSLYMIAGAVLFFTKELFPHTDPEVKQITGGVLFLYGLFRLYRFIKARKKEKEDEEE